MVSTIALILALAPAGVNSQQQQPPPAVMTPQAGPGTTSQNLAAKTQANRPLSGEIRQAQPTMPFADGARVRVTAPMLPAPLYGHAIADPANPGAFVVVTPGGHARVSMPLASASRIDVSQGRARAKVAKWGAALGFLVGGLAASKGDVTSDDPLTLLAGGAGALIGAGLGAAYAPERWSSVHSAVVSNPSYDVVLSDGARTKRLGDGTLAVRGERDRWAGMKYGALTLGGIGLIFGGRDHARGEIGGSEYAFTVIGNAVVGAAVGYFISPRRWQKLPPLRTGRQ